ncbi:UBA/THIF-type NAD/FAD binding protein [Chlorobium limicola DSM 245]|uniref:UBA/THIF-type NAD/FAD binding protein n=1 Tax=Chlorobium limicola (strain DSM 245 / NBRC 103803 / 6330) TaxID=290315 RepID=B3EH66_CHLL2|nr:HesA/MoeB/ThiF family protein [Chlorobium limicola]ACD89746.1 UBA/THIF-type NAD/FAD binding protein [Chlorobium limicola DSM 245]
MALNDEQRKRFTRHLSMDEIGEKGQEKLLQAKVLIVGAGGLGSPAAFYLAAAGIGTLGLADGDRVDLSNLQRQILHTTASAGTPKVSSAAERIHALNPATRLALHPFHLDEKNAEALIARYDFVIDATDSFRAKFLIAKTCHREEKPYSHAGITSYYGHTITVQPGKTACYNCIFHETEPAAEADAHLTVPAGPLGPLPGIIGSIQAAEALKHILSIGKGLHNTLLSLDLLTMTFRSIPVNPDPNCPICGKKN